MIYVTGDIHGSIDINKLSKGTMKQRKYQGHYVPDLKQGDYLIICGDFGLVWSLPDTRYYEQEQYWLKWLENQPYTTLFVDGNHENFDLLNSYPVEQWQGGKVQKIRENIIHLMRGQVFEIEGNRIFTFGGAESHDKFCRELGVSLWEQELPDDIEYKEAITNLEKCNYTVDYVITHCSGKKVQDYIYKNMALYPDNALVQFFDEIDKKLKYKIWFNGHYHINTQVGRHVILYGNIVPMQDYTKYDFDKYR